MRGFHETRGRHFYGPIVRVYSYGKNLTGSNYSLLDKCTGIMISTNIALTSANCVKHANQIGVKYNLFTGLERTEFTSRKVIYRDFVPNVIESSVPSEDVYDFEGETEYEEEKELEIENIQQEKDTEVNDKDEQASGDKEDKEVAESENREIFALILLNKNIHVPVATLNNESIDNQVTPLLSFSFMNDFSSFFEVLNNDVLSATLVGLSSFSETEPWFYKSRLIDQERIEHAKSIHSQEGNRVPLDSFLVTASSNGGQTVRAIGIESDNPNNSYELFYSLSTENGKLMNFINSNKLRQNDSVKTRAQLPSYQVKACNGLKHSQLTLQDSNVSRYQYDLVVNQFSAGLCELNSKSMQGQIVNQYGEGFCSGTFIDKNTLITAAHCFDQINNPRSALVKYGSTLSRTTRVSRVVIHPEYNRNLLAHDIAVVKVSTVPLSLNYANPPVNAFSEPRTNELLYYFGFGAHGESLYNDSSSRKTVLSGRFRANHVGSSFISSFQDGWHTSIGPGDSGSGVFVWNWFVQDKATRGHQIVGIHSNSTSRENTGNNQITGITKLSSVSDRTGLPYYCFIARNVSDLSNNKKWLGTKNGYVCKGRS